MQRESNRFFRLPFTVCRSPLFVRYAVQPDASRARVHIEYVFALVRFVRGAFVRAQTPGFLRLGVIESERISRQPAQKLALGFARFVDVVCACDWNLQLRWIAGSFHLRLDVPVV